MVFPLQAQDLLEHRWKERVVVITSESFDHPDARAQIKAFEDSSDELDDRLMVIYHVTPAGFRVQFDQEALPLDNKGGDFDFKVVLIGLDGGIKYESRTFEPAEAYYGLIDRMPMRRAQMRKRIKNGG